jgi:hypothetical protein
MARACSPLHEVIVFPNSHPLVPGRCPGLMSAEDRVDPLLLEQYQIGKGADIAIAEHHIARGEKSAEGVEETLFMLMQGARGIPDNHTGGFCRKFSAEVI